MGNSPELPTPSDAPGPRLALPRPLVRVQFLLIFLLILAIGVGFVITYGAIQGELERALDSTSATARREVFESLRFVRRAFIALGLLLTVGLIAFLMLGRWALRVRQQAALARERLGRLARAIQPLSAVLEQDPGAVFLVSDDGIVVYANHATGQLLDLEGPLTGRPAREIFDHLHSELRDAVISGLDAIVAQKPGLGEGEGETLLVSSRPIDIDRRPHFLYTLRPVTREVRRQEVDHWKKLIRVLSHELNNSLTPIISLMRTAQKINLQGTQDPRLTQIFETIQERTTHLVTFLESYRAVARLPMPTPRFVNWQAFVESLRLQREFRVLEPLPVRAGLFDPVQIERVIVNALDNAVEAGSQPEEIELAVRDDDDGTRIEVSDRGVGMSEATLKQAMLPFFSTKAGGTGIGLALAREIVEAHGGQLVLANREGRGLTVTILLPPPRAGMLAGGRTLTGEGLLPRGTEEERTDGSVPPESEPESLTGTRGLSSLEKHR